MILVRTFNAYFPLATVFEGLSPENFFSFEKERIVLFYSIAFFLNSYIHVRLKKVSLFGLPYDGHISIKAVMMSYALKF